jgi:hypothetical protein
MSCRQEKALLFLEKGVWKPGAGIKNIWESLGRNTYQLYRTV